MSLSDLTHASFSEIFTVKLFSSIRYTTILMFGIGVLAAPVLLVGVLTNLLDLPQPLLFPVSVGILVVDLYLGAHLSRLFAYFAGTGRLPGRAIWALPAGMAWKLAVALLLAPWPFDIAFAILGEHSHIYLQLPVFLLAAVATMAVIAVMAAILAEAYRLAWRD